METLQRMWQAIKSPGSPASDERAKKIKFVVKGDKTTMIDSNPDQESKRDGQGLTRHFLARMLRVYPGYDSLKWPAFLAGNGGTPRRSNNRYPTGATRGSGNSRRPRGRRTRPALMANPPL